MADIRMMALEAREACPYLSSSPIEMRNRALILIGEKIVEHSESILEKNARDVAAAEEAKLAKPLISRLRLTESKLDRMIEGLRALAQLPDPLNKTQYAKELAPGLKLYRTSCPIGVVGVIFESRPDALVQISSLCLKSGNAVLLKGGSEARLTNEALWEAIREGTSEAGFPNGWIGLLQSRQDVSEMLAMDDCIDLIIPRGSNEFVRYIMHNSAIPVLGHSDGICHVYVDEYADIDMAVKLTVDSKTQSLAVCNATETLLVHEAIAAKFLPMAAKALTEKGVELRGCEKTRQYIPCVPATEQDWSTEYLDLILSVRVVGSLDEAIYHINHYGSHHTDTIVSQDMAAVQRFMALVDSAGVFQNCSTRFSDGFLYGFGAEVGIATGKLHARGPMGLEGLCTYKYKLFGSGQTLQGLSEGEYSLTHKPLGEDCPN